MYSDFRRVSARRDPAIKLKTIVVVIRCITSCQSTEGLCRSLSFERFRAQLALSHAMLAAYVGFNVLPDGRGGTNVESVVCTEAMGFDKKHALSATLNLPADATRAQLLDAMKGRHRRQGRLRGPVPAVAPLTSTFASRRRRFVCSAVLGAWSHRGPRTKDHGPTWYQVPRTKDRGYTETEAALGSGE